MSDSSPPPHRQNSWFAEIRRRRVFRVSGAYVLVAWILMQAGEIIFPAFELPNSALRILIVSLMAGLPCIILLAWFLDVTPAGIRITHRLKGSLTEPGRNDGSEEEENADQAGPSLEIILLGIVVPLFAFAFLLGYFALNMEAPASDGESSQGIQVDESIPSLAVLPFEDLSAKESDGGFFARGMHEDLLTRLFRIKPLKLISRTSVMSYAGTTKNLREIGRELGVKHILEGSVRRTDTHVRVTAQLVRADTDEHVWAKNFDAELEDVFAVQTQISDAIALGLEANLAPSAAATSEIVVPAAYDAYLKARDLHRNLDSDDRSALGRIRHLYETAVRSDPSLALAYLQLAILHAQSHWFQFDLGETPSELARANLARAVESGVEPDQHALAEGVLAYYLDRDFGKALLHFEDVAKRAPSDAEAIFYRAMILRRMGQLEAALSAQYAALELDPLNLAYRDELALTLALSGQLEQARAELERTLLIDPSRSRAQLQKWQIDLELDGRPESLLEDMLSQTSERWHDPHYSLLETVAVLAGRPERALEAIKQRPPTNPDTGFRDYQRAVLEGFMGNEAAKQGWLDRAWKKFTAQRDGFEAEEGESRPTDSVEALFAAQRGDFDQALALQEGLVEGFPIERDLIEGAPRLWQLLDLQLRAGRIEEASESFDRLARHVELGSMLNGGHYVLRDWPEYAAARSDPSWAALLEKAAPEYVREWASPSK